MDPKDKKEKTGVAKIRERFFERMRNWTPSPELEKIIRQRKPDEKKEETEQPRKKIAKPKRREDLDL